jgi:glycosyltransferase involved in cell wall biosynthesis
MKISVILCTYNRSGILPKALDGIAGQIVSESDQYEVLVVDNNSSDRTRDVVEEFCRRYPDRFHYLFEAQQGLSHARNAGIKHARGEVLVFVDDDVATTDSWLRNLVAPMHDEPCAGVGGRILPQWTCEPPHWLATDGRYALAPFAVFDLGPEAGPLLEPPLGANMAFRKTMFARYGYFRVDLGRSGTGMLSNEDTEFGRRLLKAGEVLHYAASAVVYHPVSEDRLQKSYLLNWWFSKGRSDIREYGPRAGTQYYFKGVPLYLLRNLARAVICWTFALDPRRRFHHKSTAWGKLGAILESYRLFQTATAGLETNAAGLPHGKDTIY